MRRGLHLTPQFAKSLSEAGYPQFVAEHQALCSSDHLNAFLLRRFVAMACKYVEYVNREGGRESFTKFRKWKVTADMAYGFIGERGSGKSTTGAHLCLRDCMMLDEPCWSNLKIVARLVIGDIMDEVLWEMENAAGIELDRESMVIYRSLPLNVEELLSPNCQYRHGYICVDEINIELADAWRAMSNDALAASDLMQTLRKLQSALVFTSISEMFIPNRVRDAADVYFKLQDYAFINTSKLYGQPQGHDYRMQMYLMSSRFAGEDRTYARTHEPYTTIQVHGHDLWGLVDTWDRKSRQKRHSHLYGQSLETVEGSKESDTIALNDDDFEAVQSETVKADLAEWSWLYYHPFINRMLETGARVEKSELLSALAPDAPPHSTKEAVLAHFEDVCNPSKVWSNGKCFYHFAAFDKRDFEKEKREWQELVPSQ